MVYKELDLVGSNLSNYKITEKLGRGGMATVYKAHELSLNRIVALKVLSAKLADDEEFIKRFQREAQAAAKLNHPNIVQIYAIGEEKGIHFFAMEYIKGNTLSEILKEEKIFKPDIAASYITQVARGLSLAHKEGLVHRDIKPSNILIDKKDNAKIADFGIAFVQDAKTKLTREGSIIGTPEYLSPEQCEGKKLDGRSDIYSLGVTFYEILTGKTPYDADTPVSMIMKIVNGTFPPLSEVQPDIPKKKQNIIEKMMNTNPSERYENADKLLEDLESLETGGVLSNKEQIPPTNVLEKDEISGIVDNFQGKEKNGDKGSGKRAFLFIAAIIIILVGIAFAAKILYFDKQNKTGTSNNNQEVAANNNALNVAGKENNETEKTVNSKNDIDEKNTDNSENSENITFNNEAGNELQSESTKKQNTIASKIESDNPSVNKEVDSEIVSNGNLEKPPEKLNKIKKKKKVTPMPPERSFVISLSGSNAKVELISSYMQNKLQKKGYIIIDPIAVEGKPVIEIARSHMIISVNDLGSTNLKYYGSETVEYTVNISVKIISPQNGRIQKGPVNKTVRYTNINVDENFRETVDKLIGSLNL